MQAQICCTLSHQLFHLQSQLLDASVTGIVSIQRPSTNLAGENEALAKQALVDDTEHLHREAVACC
jgi:hypothetical protein